MMAAKKVAEGWFGSKLKQNFNVNKNVLGTNGESLERRRGEGKN